MKVRKIVIIILCILAVLLISIGIIKLLPSAVKETKKENIELRWDSYYGERIPSDYEVYTATDYLIYNFNLDTTENKTSFDIKLPKEATIQEFNDNSVIYKYKNLTFDISKTNANNIYKELDVVKENNEYLYEKVYIESTKYDESIFAILVEYAKYNGNKTSMMFGQEVRIYIKAKENEFALVNIYTNESRIDKETISEIINSITIKSANDNLCKNNKCEVKLKKFHNSLNDKFTLNINKDKYVLEYNEGISGLNAYFITKEYDKAIDKEDGIKKLTSIDIKLIYNNPTYIDNLPYQEEVEIDGKKVIKSYKENNIEGITQYKGTYVYSPDNKLLVIIDIDSRVDNVEEVLKDFIKFTIK